MAHPKFHFFDAGKEIPRLTCVGVFAGDRPQKTEHGTIYPYAEFLRRVWDGTLIR